MKKLSGNTVIIINRANKEEAVSIIIKNQFKSFFGDKRYKVLESNTDNKVIIDLSKLTSKYIKKFTGYERFINS